MSQENVDLVRSLFEALNRRDIEALLEGLDPEVELRPVLQTVMLGREPTVSRGHEGARDAFREWDDTFADIHVEISQAQDLGERIVAIGQIRARGRESGATVESPGGWVLDCRNGKVVLLREYLDPKEALEAAGLSD
jgi:ketosteroid isomerase-like protein